MSQALIATKKRMKSVSNTAKITRAMKLVSTAKLKSEMKQMEASKSYCEALNNITSNLIGSLYEVTSPYREAFNASKKLFVVVTSSLGLCGSYNHNVFIEAEKMIAPNDDVIILGNKGKTHFKDSKFNIIHTFDNYENISSKKVIDDLADFILDIYPKGTYSEISFIYTNYVNSIKFSAVLKRILPLNSFETKDKNYDPIVEPNKKEVIEKLIPFYVKNIVLSLLIESEVSEQASRRNAMESATENADELYSKLSLEYNKARQNSITQEIIEVSSAKD